MHVEGWYVQVQEERDSIQLSVPGVLRKDIRVNTLNDREMWNVPTGTSVRAVQ